MGRAVGHSRVGAGAREDGGDAAVREALDILDENDTPMDYMRIRAFPFDQPVEDFIAEHEFCYVIEQNRDAQLRSLLILETSAVKEKLRSILVYGGFPLSASHVLNVIAPKLSTVTTEELDAIYR